MRSLILLVAFFLEFVSIVVATKFNSTDAENPSATPVGVIRPEDIGIQPLFRGRPVPQAITIYTLYHAQLVLYRRTVQRRGDGVQGPMDFNVDDETNLRLEIRPFEQEGRRNDMTLGSSFYGIASMIMTMLNPEDPADGFFELKWRIFNRALVPGFEVPMGYLNLLRGSPEAFHNVTSNSPASALQSMATPNMSWASTTHLFAPFSVPETDVTLLIGTPGANLVQGDVILIMVNLMNTAWQNVAHRHRVQAVNGQTWNSELRDRVSVTLRPRMNGRTSICTDTDLAEAAFGLAYYFTTRRPAFAAKITIVKPNESGRRVPIGEIEISSRPPEIEISGSGNDTAVGTS